jgi:GTPase SAR1 family protein
LPALPTQAAKGLSPDQETARMAILRAVAAGAREIVLAGPAGSGKTTLMRQVLDDLQAMRLNVIPMAPTGKAALRLTQLTGRAAKTIHALIYTRCEESPDGDLHFGDVSWHRPCWCATRRPWSAPSCTGTS